MILAFKYNSTKEIRFAHSASHLTDRFTQIVDFNIEDYAEAETIKNEVSNSGFSAWYSHQLHKKGELRLRAQWFKYDWEVIIPSKVETW